MWEYTGNYFTIRDSKRFGQTVHVLEYKSKSSVPWGECLLCGKMLKRHWWTIQTDGDDLIIGDVGSECVKKLD